VISTTTMAVARMFQTTLRLDCSRSELGRKKNR